MDLIKQRFIGDKSFYKRTINILIPIVIQTTITNFVNMLDNIMVGSLGTIPMSAVSIANQILFIYMLALFGAVAGASIYGTQFFGSGDMDGVRHIFRFKLYAALTFLGIAILVIFFYSDNLVMLFLNESTNSPEVIAETLKFSREYFIVILFSLIPFSFLQVYAGTLKDAGETKAPMRAGIIAVLTNLVLNYALIFGKLGFPQLGVTGAAIATLIARLVEFLYILVYAHKNQHKFTFIKGLYSSLKIPKAIVLKTLKTGTPLVINEIMYSLCATFIMQNYSLRGISAVASVTIVYTVWNVFSIMMFSFGGGISILVGQELGKGDIENAKDVDRKLIFLGVALNVVLAILMFLLAPLFPDIYNTEPHVKELAVRMLKYVAILTPINAFVHMAYFTIRSGGKTLVTFFFDSFSYWLISGTLSFVLCRFTNLDIFTCFVLVQTSEILKIVVAIPILKSGSWAKNVISDIR